MSVQQSGQPLTRRQLREMERAAQAAAEKAAAAEAPADTSPASAEPTPVAPALAHPTAAAPAAPEPTPVEPAPQPEVQRPAFGTGKPMSRRELRALLRAQEPDDEPERPAPAEQSAAAEEIVLVDEVEEVTDAGAAVHAEETSVRLEDLRVEGEPVPQTTEPPAAADEKREEEASASRTFQPPTGHWSLAVSDDPEDTAESSGIVTSSNSLIIPTVPSIADVTAPLTSTGEILVTGSIDLPRSLGSTGQIPNRFDNSDIDDLYEHPEVADSGVAPVSAVRAISSHGMSMPSITPPKNRGTRLTTILAISAGVLAVVVAGLFVAGYVFHIF